ncbi:methyltransferase domain-containing protein [Cocleimonas flava]|uniref:Tellurite resistance protein TehB n=1 Tax=Cocleimonas flava TaxID=634765 RepID=A0A4R1ERA2_9GAMM|nr:methyltransferase domain-containing protein [Cocleimonas flava]TCJ82990.1 tellurite resistance protein TehB [Cocleimonas flava]
MSVKKDKWDQAYQQADFSSAKVATVLSDNAYLLPLSGGDALDLACGRAGNAQFLEKIGFAVDAIDISSVVLEGLARYSLDNDLKIKTILCDVETNGMSEKKYDVIVVSYFLNRELFPQIIDSLKPGGLLFYQTWSQLKVTDAGPGNPDFRLKAGELLALCDSLKIVLYRENGVLGKADAGLRNEALIIAQKP